MRLYGWPGLTCIILSHTEITAISLSRATIKEAERKPPMSPEKDVNLLQKYVDAIDNPTPFIPPIVNPSQAQYVIKALDYLKIWSREHDDLVEEPLHTQLDEMMVDIVANAPGID